MLLDPAEPEYLILLRHLDKMQALDICLGVFCLWLPRRKPLGSALLIQLLDGAVDPTEAQGFLHRVVVLDARFAGCFLIT